MTRNDIPLDLERRRLVQNRRHLLVPHDPGFGGATAVFLTPGAAASSRPCPGNSCHGSTTTTTTAGTTTSATTTTTTGTTTPPTTTTSGTSSPSYTIPSSIPGDCSVDVTQQILSWIASVPDNAVLNFGQSACYAIEGTLEFRGRTSLDFEGHGSTFRSFTAPADQRAIWRAIGLANNTFHNMTIRGSYANGGTFNSSLQHAHAIDLRGTSATVANLSLSDVAGDCVYFGLGYNVQPAMHRVSALHPRRSRDTQGLLRYHI
jgi:hypothetical protein